MNTIVKSFKQNQGSIIQTYRRHYSVRDSPSFESKGSASDLLQSGRSCSVRNEELV